MSEVSAILPAKGRLEATLSLLPRLRQSAGMVFDLIVVVDDDREVYQALNVPDLKWITLLKNDQRQGYWKSLVTGTAAAHGKYLVNLANDILPGRAWLKRALEAYKARFADEPAIIGFNDGINPGTAAGHFMADRRLLESFYGAKCWPDCYDHMLGDTEIAERALSLRRFAVAPWALLFHNHEINGAPHDAVYQLSHERENDDRALYQRRRAAAWAL